MADVRWLSDDEQAFWRLYLATVSKVYRVVDEDLQKNHGLSNSDFGVLVSLSEAEGKTLRLHELGELLDWDRSRTSHQITRMEKRGLVEKTKCASDQRGVNVVLTDAGMSKLLDAVPGHVETVRKALFDVIDTADQAALTKALRKIYEA